MTRSRNSRSPDRGDTLWHLMAGRTLITAFTAFDRFAANPSALIAGRLDRPHVLLEVAYAAVDAFVTSLEADSFDRAVLLGVAGMSSTFRLETCARNGSRALVDVRGHVPASATIDPAAPVILIGTLWPSDLLANPPEHVARSDDAGGYLCNYLYFRMLQRFTDKRIGFLHVPPLEAMDLDRQVEIVRSLLARVEPNPSV